MTEPHDPEDAHDPDTQPWAERGPVPEEPPTAPGWAPPDAPPPHRTGGRSHRVRTGVVAGIVALALLGGGFGAGYAVADASSATHAAVAKGHHEKAERMRRQQGRTGSGRST